MKMFKGFNKDLQCVPGGKVFQYEIGKTYEESSAELCDHGFHACEVPLDVFGYYAPGDGSRYCEVELDGLTDEAREDSKRCGTKLTVGAEIGIPGLVKAHVEYVKEHLDSTKKQQEMDGYRSAATNTGNYSAATNTGNYSAATNTGYRSAAEVAGKDSVAIVTGYKSKAKGTLGCWLVLTERNDKMEIVNMLCVNVDDESAKADTWYMLENGELTECE